MLTNEQLKNMCMLCNNVIMSGSFSGDNITLAADAMFMLQEVYSKIVDSEGSADEISPEHT